VRVRVRAITLILFSRFAELRCFTPYLKTHSHTNSLFFRWSLKYKFIKILQINYMEYVQ